MSKFFATLLIMLERPT